MEICLIERDKLWNYMSCIIERRSFDRSNFLLLDLSTSRVKRCWRHFFRPFIEPELSTITATRSRSKIKRIL